MTDGGADYDDDDVVLAEQPQTAIFWNKAGNIACRQRGEVFEDDPFVVFAPQNLPAVIERLIGKLVEYENPFLLDELQHRLRSCGLFAAKAQKTSSEPEPQPAARLTGAERQRRFRERHKQTSGDLVAEAAE